MMFHWRAMLVGVALACGVGAGCTRQLFVGEDDLQRVGSQMIPPQLETHPQDVVRPTFEPMGTPPDVRHSDRPARRISLEECLAIGLENGNSNSRSVIGGGAGIPEDFLTASPGAGPTQISESIRVWALQPAISKTVIENQLARFDASWVNELRATTTDSIQQGLQSFQNGQSTNAVTGLFKTFSTGGTITTSFQTEYRMLTNPPLGGINGVLNPQYTTRATIGFEQPLWQNYGAESNQLITRAQFPQFLNGTGLGFYNGHQNSIGPVNAVAEGILISRVRYEQQKGDFERQLNALVLNIEQAYWKLYQAYGNLFAYEEVLRIAHRSWIINKAKFDVGNIGPAIYFPILAQYQEFRGERLNALASVLEKERNLRGLMGLPYEDGTRLVPITAPTMAPYEPNFEAAVKDALTNRPELAIAREGVRVAQLNLLLQKNFVKPDVRGFALYSPVGFGNRLDGNGSFVDGTGTPRTNNALQSLISDHYNDWSVGVSLNVPLGYRAEFANIRAARLILAQHYYALKDQEERAKRLVTTFYQDLSKWHDLIEIRREERKAYAEAVEARFKEAVAGKASFADFMLDIQRRLAQAQLKEYEAIAEYNSTLARFEWSKGSVLQHNNIFIAEGPLPEAAQRRAVEHERERSLAYVCREKPRPIVNPGELVDVSREISGDPHLINLNGVGVPENVGPTILAPEASPQPAPDKLPKAPLKAPEQAAAPSGQPGQGAAALEFQRESASVGTMLIEEPTTPAPTTIAPVSRPTTPPSTIPSARELFPELSSPPPPSRGTSSEIVIPAPSRGR